MNYKAPDNSLHFIEPEFAHLLPAGSVPITDEEAEALRPVPQPPSIQSQIDALDGGDPMARPTREFMILSLEKEALAAGYTVAQLRANHYGYRKVKELDEQIAALRAQL